ncbi:MAG: hypothetical protein NTU60_12255 [Candidatus Aminicenantes bacterium]|nr:hypothetical protein [Candidatus Aminicenantes bacterium]
MAESKKYWRIRIFRGDKKRLLKVLLIIALFSTALVLGGLVGQKARRGQYDHPAVG